MNPPRLLTLDRLLKPSLDAVTTLQEIRDKLPGAGSGSVELKGLLVMMIATVETMLIDTYVYYLRSFPEAFDFKDAKFSKEDILAANLALDLIEQKVEKRAITQAYGSFPELLRTFTRTLSIDTPPLDEDEIEQIVDAKETRNLLLHSNLRVSRRHLVRPRRSQRGVNSGAAVSLPQQYVDNTCSTLLHFIEGLQTRMRSKYSSYTRLAALRRLWEYLFSSPIMPFDDFWVTDDEQDRITALKISPREENLSSSEQIFLGVWRMHFNDWRNLSHSITMNLLDSQNKRKMLWFLATLSEFRID